MHMWPAYLLVKCNFLLARFQGIYSPFKCPFGLARYVAFLHRRYPSLLPGHSQAVCERLGLLFGEDREHEAWWTGTALWVPRVGAARGVFFVHTASVDDHFAAVTRILLLLLSSSSLSPLCRVFILIFLRQTMSLGNTVLQLFCCYYSWCLYR